MRRVERLLACMFLCCMVVCGEDVELKQDLGVKNQGEIATAKATVPGKMTSAEVKNYDGWNGWKGGIASENSAEFNTTVPAGFSGGVYVTADSFKTVTVEMAVLEMAA